MKMKRRFEKKIIEKGACIISHDITFYDTINVNDTVNQYNQNLAQSFSIVVLK